MDLFKLHVTTPENSVLPRWYSPMIVSLLSFTCLPIWPYHRLAVVVSSSKLLRARKKTHAHCIGIHFYDPPWSLLSQNIRNKVLGKDMFSKFLSDWRPNWSFQKRCIQPFVNVRLPNKQYKTKGNLNGDIRT